MRNYLFTVSLSNGWGNYGFLCQLTTGSELKARWTSDIALGAASRSCVLHINCLFEYLFPQIEQWCAAFYFIACKLWIGDHHIHSGHNERRNSSTIRIVVQSMVTSSVFENRARIVRHSDFCAWHYDSLPGIQVGMVRESSRRRLGHCLHSTDCTCGITHCRQANAHYWQPIEYIRTIKLKEIAETRSAFMFGWL